MMFKVETRCFQTNYKQWDNLLGKYKSFRLFKKRPLSCTKWLFHYLEYHQTKTCFARKETILINFSIFDKNYGLSPLENFSFARIYKSIFFSCGMAFLPCKTYPKTFFRSILLKNEKFQNLLGLSSFEDINVFTMKKLTLFFSRMALLPYRK